MSADQPQQLLLGFTLDDNATLDSFLVSAADQPLLQHLQENVLQGRELLTVIWGNSGTGKTHLLQGLCHALACANGSSIYIPLARADHFAPDMLDELEQLDLVCLDDIDAIAGMAEWERAVFNLYNRSRDCQVRLVVASGKPLARLQLRLPDLKSRLQSGVLYQLHELDEMEKARLLQQRAKALGFQLPDTVVSYVLQRHERSVAALTDLLRELDRQSLERKRPITVPLIREIMGW